MLCPRWAITSIGRVTDGWLTAGNITSGLQHKGIAPQDFELQDGNESSDHMHPGGTECTLSAPQEWKHFAQVWKVLTKGYCFVFVYCPISEFSSLFFVIHFMIPVFYFNIGLLSSVHRFLSFVYVNFSIFFNKNMQFVQVMSKNSTQATSKNPCSFLGD